MEAALFLQCLFHTLNLTGDSLIGSVEEGSPLPSSTAPVLALV